jgi:uncharacterized membrane protein
VLRTQASFFPELFPTHIRCSGIALIWQVGSLIGSGVLGLVAVKILQMTGGHYYGMAAYVIVLGVISVIGLALMPETAPRRRRANTNSGDNTDNKTRLTALCCPLSGRGKFSKNKLQNLILLVW